MTSTHASAGPFRQDARERLFASALSGPTEGDRFSISAFTYVIVLALGPLGAALYAASMMPIFPTALLLLLAYWVRQKLTAPKTSTGARRVTLVPEGILIDGSLGPGRYEWRAVRGLTVRADRIILDLVQGQQLVLRPESDIGALERMIRAHVELRIFDRPGRLLLLLAILYALCIAETLIALGP